MEDIRNTRYANWLEDVCKTVMELKPITMGVYMMAEDGTVCTAYSGEISPQDKAMMAHHFYTDAMFEIMRANAKAIVDAAKEEEEDGTDVC